MVAVIVHHGHAPHFAAHFEAPAHAGELAQPFANHIRRDVQFQRDRDGRRRIQNVVLAGNVQMELAQIRRARAQREKLCEIAGFRIARLIVGLRIAPVGDGAPLHGAGRMLCTFSSSRQRIAAP
jgi:hypothetical protein